MGVRRGFRMLALLSLRGISSSLSLSAICKLSSLTSSPANRKKRLFTKKILPFLYGFVLKFCCVFYTFRSRVFIFSFFSQKDIRKDMRQLSRNLQKNIKNCSSCQFPTKKIDREMEKCWFRACDISRIFESKKKKSVNKKIHVMQAQWTSLFKQFLAW